MVTHVYGLYRRYREIIVRRLCKP